MANEAQEGIQVLGNYTDPATVSAKFDAFLALIPDVDVSPAQSGGGLLDMMHPAAAVAIRVEATALKAAVLGDVEDTDSVSISDGDTVHVLNSAGADSHDATVVVTAGVLTGVKLAATACMVDDGDVLPIHNSADADSHNATAHVAVGAFTSANFAATVAMVDSGDTASGKTMTVTAGVVSAIA